MFDNFVQLFANLDYMFLYTFWVEIQIYRLLFRDSRCWKLGDIIWYFSTWFPLSSMLLTDTVWVVMEIKLLWSPLTLLTLLPWLVLIYTAFSVQTEKRFPYKFCKLSLYSDAWIYTDNTHLPTFVHVCIYIGAIELTYSYNTNDFMYICLYPIYTLCIQTHSLFSFYLTEIFPFTWLVMDTGYYDQYDGIANNIYCSANNEIYRNTFVNTFGSSDKVTVMSDNYNFKGYLIGIFTI